MSSVRELIEGLLPAPKKTSSLFHELPPSGREIDLLRSSDTRYTSSMKSSAKLEDYFSSLVDNALDFLSRSIDDFEHYPKYSVIHFHAAVELFVKARLMSEHWSLVVTQRKEADWEKFVAGDFQSAGLEEAAGKLEKVVQSGISESTLQAFRDVGKHRNKMVHFFHKAHPFSENKRLRTKVAKEQLNAWYLLNQLLTGPWKDVFDDWLPQISEIDTRLRDHRKYLQVIFDNLKPEIEARKQEGFEFRACPSCQFEAQERNPDAEDIDLAVCWVCGFKQKFLTVDCPECCSPVEFADEGFSECGSCGKYLEPEHIVYALKYHGAAYAAAKEGDYSWDDGNCSNCDGYHTVVCRASGKYICGSCLGEFESMQPCEWCDELNTGDMEDSYLHGCNQCEGRLGYGD